MTIDDLLSHPLVLLLAVLVALLGAGRLARLITYDAYPPTIWLRIQWARLTHDGGWTKLANCFWCLTPWIMLPTIGWFLLGALAPWIGIAWWAFFSWLAMSYVASMIVARDEPPETP